MNVSVRIVLAFVMVLGLASCGSASTAPATSGNALIVTAKDAEFAFAPTELTAKSGETVTLTFNNTSVLNHNLILIKDDMAILAKVDAGADLSGDAGGYIPTDKTDIVATTKLLTPGSSETITFTAPAPGKYLYFCTYPAHLEGSMKGSLTVN
jgi:plastocyanin